MDDVLDGAMQVLDEEEVIFTDQEWDLFERRIEEGYDFPPSGRYLLWLEMYHCEPTRCIDRILLTLSISITSWVSYVLAYVQGNTELRN